ncbi:MAG: CinA family nicotinamide mononucleotide deamidase-related protein [Chitinophagaceae bacterium]
MQQTATIITIGDELLIGQTIDTNSAWMAQQLNALGISVLRRIAIADDREAIIGALDEEIPRCDFLLITGGLGPTADDITKPVLAEYFGGKMVMDEAVLAHVQAIFSKRSRPMLERNTLQAQVPDCCEVLFNKLGTAPGMSFEKDGKVIVSMAGVPFEMMHIMEEGVLPRIRKMLKGNAIVHRSIVTAGEGESFLAETIKDLEEALPAHIKLAYLPHAGMVRLRLTGKSMDEMHLIKEVELRRDEIAGRLNYCVVSLEDLPLEQIVAKSFVAKGVTLGLAESCTGGDIANRFTQIMGSSQFFNGSIVCYQTEVKERLLGVAKLTLAEHSVYSEEVALEMARGASVALGASVGFGITGLLSGFPEGNIPVGTICMAAVNGEREISHTVRCYSDRIRNKELALTHALLFLWKFINHKL